MTSSAEHLSMQYVHNATRLYRRNAWLILFSYSIKSLHPDRSTQNVSPVKRKPENPFAFDSASLFTHPCNTSSAEKVCPGVYQSLMERICICPDDKYRLKSGTAPTIKSSAMSASSCSDVTHRHDSFALRPASKYGTKVSAKSSFVR